MIQLKINLLKHILAVLTKVTEIEKNIMKLRLKIFKKILKKI
jgi:hypothetical protein